MAGVKKLVADCAKTIINNKVKRSNAFDILFRFTNFGVGQKITRGRWMSATNQAGTTYWTVTRVVPELNEETRRRGKAYGVLTWNGELLPKEMKIRSTLKREWLLLREEGTPPIDPLPQNKETINKLAEVEAVAATKEQ